MTQEMLDKINQANAFMHHNHIRVVRQERDQAAVSLELCPDSLNPFGMLHGGAYFTLADCAGGAAARSDGRRYVTLEGSIHFIRAANEGTVTAQARVRSRGGTTCLVEIDIKDETERLLATGNFTFFCVGTLET